MNVGVVKSTKASVWYARMVKLKDGEVSEEVLSKAFYDYTVEQLITLTNAGESATSPWTVTQTLREMFQQSLFRTPAGSSSDPTTYIVPMPSVVELLDMGMSLKSIVGVPQIAKPFVEANCGSATGEVNTQTRIRWDDALLCVCAWNFRSTINEDLW